MADALTMLLIRFRRRLIAARAIRLMGAGALLVAGACLAAVMVERFSAVELLARTAVVAVLAAGLLMSFRLLWQMPPLAAAALEIDRQKDLHELLSSAALADGRGDMSDCVMIAAQRKATEVELSQLATGSLGVPMWVAALLIAGLLPLLHRPAFVASRQQTNEIAKGEMPAPRETRRAGASLSHQRPVTQEGETPGASAITVAALSDRQHPVDAGRRPTRSDTAGLSAGGGLAQGSSATPPVPPVATPAAARPGEGSASGSGAARAGSTGSDEVNGQAAGMKAQIDARAESSGTAQGQGAVNAESFPESYRDVLKAYFAR